MKWLKDICSTLFSSSREGIYPTVEKKVVQESKEAVAVKEPEPAPHTIEYVRKHFDPRTDIVVISQAARQKLDASHKAWINGEVVSNKVVEFKDDSLVNVALIRCGYSGFNWG